MRALRDESGRGLQHNGRAATVGCADCCGPIGYTVYYLACPCLAYFQDQCAIPDEPCIYIDVRSSLSDGLVGDALYDALLRSTVPDPVTNQPIDPPIIVRVGGICYRMGPSWYADSLDPNDARIGLIPADATKVGGPGEAIERRENCVDGCAEVNIGPEYFELFRCDGCPMIFRLFGCARELGTWAVVSAGYGVGAEGYCVDRTVGYSQNQAESLGQLLQNPTPILVWQIGAGRPVHVPALSCCYAQPSDNCWGSRCLTGRRWFKFGGEDKWFPIDVCCGTEQGLGYTVDLAYSSTSVSGGGDPVTTTVTARVDSVTPRTGGGSVVALTITTRSQRPSIGFDQTTESPATIDLPPFCCLPYSGLVPMTTRIVDPSVIGQPAIGVPDAPGYFYSTRIDNVPAGDDAEQRRAGWNVTPWASPLRLGPREESAGVYTSTGGAFGDCPVWTFRHDETMVYDNGDRYAVSINLRVSVAASQAFPCAFGGVCGSGGWGGSIGSLLP